MRSKHTARRGGAVLLTALAVTFGGSLGAIAAPSAEAAPGDPPLFLFNPQPPPPPARPDPLPTGYFNGPCGLAADGSGNFWVSDYYHRTVSVFNSGADYQSQPLAAFIDPDPHTGPVDDPCGLALDSSLTLYVNNYHRDVVRWPFLPLPPYSTSAELPGSAGATGVAVDPADGDVFVAKRGEVSRYDSSGAFQEDFGGSDLDEAYGIAVSGFAGTAGRVYVPDAASGTVKAFDPPGYSVNAGATLTGPPGGFTSLRDSAVAVDDFSGDVYVVDNRDPLHTERPQATIQVFDDSGTYEGHLLRNVGFGAPSGLAVDNSASPRHPTGTQGRVYITTGNTHRGGVYVYPPDAATRDDPPQPPSFPPPPGSGLLFPTVTIGDPAPGSDICVGDSCQTIPSDPGDPTLTTELAGLGNPRIRYRNYARDCGAIADTARKRARQSRRLARRAKRARGRQAKRLRARAAKFRKLSRRGAQAAKRCRRARSGAGASAAASASHSTGAAARAITSSNTITMSASSNSPASADAPSAPSGGATTQGLLPGAAGFDAAVYADGGSLDTRAGSHPYGLETAVSLEAGEDLRELRLRFPPGLLLNPANGTGVLCQDSDFFLPRASGSPFAGSVSGESCPDRSQVGTIEVTTGQAGGQTRSFGLFNLQPEAGLAARFGASPFGYPLVFDARINAEVPGAYLELRAEEVPFLAAIESLELSLWGTPWAASHDSERGDCLNEEEPDFAWAKCSIGDPLTNSPRAFITLPTDCGASLDFEARATSWQDQSADTAGATSGGSLTACEGLDFNPQSSGQLSVKKASSASGFVFRFENDDDVFTDPRGRTEALVRRLVVELPDGVTLNPSVGAGLGVCTPAQLGNETPFNPVGQGCPSAANIGTFRVKLPYYRNTLEGAIYLAEPRNNPFGSLIAVYLVAKSADRGLLFKIPVELRPDPGDGTLTAIVDDLPQLPYTDLEVNFRSGQRAPIISPPRCGAATTRLTLVPWAQGVANDTEATATQIETGIDQGPCPDGSTPPFDPQAKTGGVNANVGSYTPYYVGLSRRDTEQEITSYSLVLPKGVTGKLAGIPFCPEAAIAAARANRGFAETASPSCPAASQVGRTDTGYGVGVALTYAPGRVYLAGPYNGAPLSLVTINAATVGPFDLGTIVIRSAFQVDERTAQLQIDSSASDPIPHIIDGVPLHLREVRVYMDRFQFTHNPSSCEASQMVSTLTGSGATFESPADDSVATVARHFQLLNCLTLGFRPRLGLRLRGAARRGGYPSLRASFVSRGARDSNLKRIEVEMPHSLFLAQNHIRTVCTRARFAAERCPKGSVYGRAIARTLLFDKPLRGKVYLRSSNSRLPDLVADLRSGAVRITVEGRIGPGKHGGINTFFDNLPDAPIDSFTMVLRGGRRGLLQNSVNVCKNPPSATVSALGQNNIGARFTSILRGQCKKKAKKRKRRGHTRRGGSRR